jgi:hypothetical protein
MTDHPASDPAGQGLRLVPRITTSFDPFPDASVRWWEAVDFRPEDGAAAAFALTDSDGQTVPIPPFAIGRAVLRIDGIPEAEIDARRGRDGQLVARLRADEAEPNPGVTLDAVRRLADTWQALWRAAEAATTKGQLLPARRGLLADPTFVRRAVAAHRELETLYENPDHGGPTRITAGELADHLDVPRASLYRRLGDEGLTVTDIRRMAHEEERE